MKLSTLYLISYNLLQTVAWYYIVLKIAWLFFERGFSQYSTIYKEIEPMLLCVQIAGILESVHVTLGLVKSSLIPTLGQFLGRNMVLIGGLYFIPEVQGHWAVPALLFVWGLIELVRYPFYLSSLIFSEPSKVFEWLRYTIFIPLYPLGYLLENILWYKMLPIIKSRDLHGISMPNSWNFSFDYYYFMIVWITMFTSLFPGQYQYMLAQRKKKYGAVKQTQPTKRD
eukprot:TRINITY_DN2602_c0_g1_i4.p1 TRINITY_DN2602_c0_g1~~TRINITY_DN2602_c0_g1_i4.p1  ORF type:complete len:241 (+),score=43.00 TRINITY_DN2602_c0_g1_i4:46-723(+)